MLNNCIMLTCVLSWIFVRCEVAAIVLMMTWQCGTYVKRVLLIVTLW